MEKMQKEALQATKEVVVKFIETGRVSPANFSEIFPLIYDVVLSSIAGQAKGSDSAASSVSSVSSPSDFE